MTYRRGTKFVMMHAANSGSITPLLADKPGHDGVMTAIVDAGYQDSDPGIEESGALSAGCYRMQPA